MSSSNNTTTQARRNSIRAPKVGHKKSRKGCQTCKTRRVKCDETLPECHVCRRLGLTCTYAYVDGTPAAKTKVEDGSTTHIKSSPSDSHGYADMASIAPSLSAEPVQSHTLDESRQRRFTELRLMHHWMVNVSRPFGLTSPLVWRELWYDEVPQLALQHENVLYALFAMSATHLLTTLPNDREEILVQARLKYWVWALREQTAAVTNLGSSNTDAVAFAALLITMNALVMLQERSLEPYEPPMEWLEVGRGAFAVLPDIEKVDEHRGLKILIETTEPIWSASAKLDLAVDADLAAVLSQEIVSNDDWSDADTVEAYETALSYIGSFRRATTVDGTAADVFLRWITMFPFMVPRRFTDLVLEQRPRALVTLAIFFAVLGRTKALQFLGEIGDRTIARREVHAIRDVLPPEWQVFMAWPLAEVDSSPLIAP